MLKWVRTHGNTVPRPGIYALQRSQALQIAFFQGGGSHVPWAAIPGKGKGKGI